MEQKPIRRVLIVEDDKHIAEGLQLNLRMKGYDVDIAPDGPSGLQLWKEWQPHLIVLDVMLPGIDGLSVLRNIRLEDQRLPILILSAKGDIEDKIEGLAHGVDDYLTKPFNLDEFLLRVDRLLLRSDWSNDHAPMDTSAPEEYTFGGNRIDFVRAIAHSINGETVHLTEQEIKLLKLFVINAGKPLSRSKLLEIGWSYSGRTSSRTVDNFVVRMRKYFEKNPKNPVFFKSIRSVGYLFDDQNDEGDTKRPNDK